MVLLNTAILSEVSSGSAKLLHVYGRVMQFYLKSPEVLLSYAGLRRVTQFYLKSSVLLLQKVNAGLRQSQFYLKTPAVLLT